MSSLSFGHSGPSIADRQAFWTRHPTDVARDLIGWEVFVNGVGGRLVETEAYHPQGPAPPQHAGATPPNRDMVGPPEPPHLHRL